MGAVSSSPEAKSLDGRHREAVPPDLIEELDAKCREV
jgi:hypothetical protein